jgi:hypothetical protein
MCRNKVRNRWATDPLPPVEFIDTPAEDQRFETSVIVDFAEELTSLEDYAAREQHDTRIVSPDLMRWPTPASNRNADATPRL